LRVYQALLAQRPADLRLRARVKALSHGGKGQATGAGAGAGAGESVQTFLKRILAAELRGPRPLPDPVPSGALSLGDEFAAAPTGGGRRRPRPVPSLVEGPQVLVHIAVLNGPNLNLLGEREPELYGRTTLVEIEARTRERARALGVELSWRQTNHEGELVDAI